MVSRIFSAASLLVVVGCASSGGPMFEFAPSDVPLRYSANTYSRLQVETPDGNMISQDTVRSTVALEIGSPNADGRSVSTSFEELEVKVAGNMANQRMEGGDLLGKPFTGTLKQNGQIEVRESPKSSSALSQLFDPAALFAELLAPLPPEANETAESWPVKSVITSDVGWTLTATYDGTARFAGDTTWNGQPARVIVSEGKVELNGRGMPAGAPSEVEMSMSGTSSRRYVWDAMRGVMLASRNETETEGVVVVLDFDMALPTMSKQVQEVTLRR